MRKLLKDQAGVTAIEFALLALPLFVIIMGSMEMGLQIYNKSRAESVVKQAARMSVTGDPSRIGVAGANIDQYVENQLKLTPGTDVTIEKRFYDSFSQVGTPERRISGGTQAPYCFIDTNNNQRWDENPSRNGVGGADDVIDYKVIVEYDTFFPLVTNVITGKDKVRIEAHTTVKNEPFAGNQDAEEQTCCVSAASGNPVTCQG